jgi:hypothetical protein
MSVARVRLVQEARHAIAHRIEPARSNVMVNHRRSFERRGSLVVDAYGTNPHGKSTSFQGPAEMFAKLRWEDRSSRSFVELSPERREHDDQLRKRLTDCQPMSMSNDDLLAISELGEPRLALLIEPAFKRMKTAWQRQEKIRLSNAAYAVLSFNRNHVLAATTLESLLLGKATSAFERLQVAGCISSALRLEFQTDAMFILRRALSRVLHDSRTAGWAPWVYPCVGHLLGLHRSETLARCRADLKTQDEWSRHVLIGELGQVVGADVLMMLAGHLEAEPSQRLKIQLLQILGELLPSSKREEVLALGLCDESPSCRFLSIKALRRLDPRSRRILAEANMRHEPDPLLRGLLGQVVEASKRPRTRGS